MSFHIVINGKKHYPGKPKAKVWRELMEFEDSRGKIDIETINFEVEKYANIIAKAFSNHEVTKELILEFIDLEDIIPLYSKTFDWFCALLRKKLANLPNVETTEK